MRQRLFNDVEVFFQRGDRRFDFRHVAQLWRGADQAPKDDARLQILRIERRIAEFRRQVAHDGVGLPQHEVIVLQQRHQAVRVQRAVTLFVNLAERAAGVDVGIAQSQFGGAPQHLPDVVRILTTPNGQHGITPLAD